ncbi:MAG: Ferritin Dps family protein [candidate division TA06 bacterium 32_111]|uniref:Ferritin n=2 Tax=Bacteria candidate phyla TaxID=1783234 RepID=A0A101I264_UNCT6|nr:MAG: Ferritin Dps family protein [candidate division TA06 bacterium 32_111]KUK87406.1 MAG: Ferritin Dps family protein [candidate division TA06 bacterium 34_109]HAF07760.1 ferritin [candidate division WOR-3 bacterium]HCP17278.1 ferritin [candidate division WOR-3 bacterium]
MISEKMVKEINDQIQRELFSEYLYLQMAAYFKGENLDGFAHWIEVQAREEHTHAMKFFNHLYERGAKVVLQPIQQPKNDFKSPLDTFKYAYEHELTVTKNINNLMELAKKENDYASESFLKWYVDEQVEEEDSFLKIVSLLEKIKDSSNALFMLNNELGKRE